MSRERWLVTGASGQLGSHIVARLVGEARSATVFALAGEADLPFADVDVRRVDLADEHALRAVLEGVMPTHILHLGAMTAVGDCYREPTRAQRVNVDATRTIAAYAARHSVRLVFSSTDMVFDGTHAPYSETDIPRPLSIYGKTKLAAEREIAECPQALIARVPLMYGLPLNGRETTFVKQLRALRAGAPLRLFADEYRTPAWLGDVARALIGLARRADASGVLHVTGPERLSRYDLIARCADLLGIIRPNLVAASRLDIDAPEPRPPDLSLDGSVLAARYPKLAPGPLGMEALQPVA